MTHYSLLTIPAALAFTSMATAASFYYNNVGYDTGKPVTIIVESTDDLAGTQFTISNGSTGTFYQGSDPDKWLSGRSKSGKYYVANLGSNLPAGTYSISFNGNKSPEITVAENALAEKTLKMVMDYFYKDRASNSTIMGWDSKVSVYGSSGVTRDVRGGWYDASGDVSKYLSHLSYANYLNPQQIPLTVWALAFAANRIPKMLSNHKGSATAAEEALYGADFLLRMLDDQGFFYMTVFDNWGMGSRYLCAFSTGDGIKSADYQTAFREGGGMAIAALARASTLGATGEFTSIQYLEGAKKAYAHLSEKQSIGGSCAYCDDGKENIIDDYTALLAATELYAATGENAYLLDADKRAKSLVGRLSKDGYFWSDDAKTRPFWHASDAGLPLIALIRYAEVGIEACVGGSCNGTHVNDAIEQHFKWLISVTNNGENPFGYARQTYKTGGSIKDGFFIPHDNESNYWWQGEDARIASLAAAATYASRALGLKDYEGADKYATDQLDWILGKNPYGVCMMNGFPGTKVPAEYDGQSNYDATLPGGIANGITGRNKDGSGIAWDDDGVTAVGFPYDEPWNNWRWIEQWIPHSTWYLMALATRYDEKIVKLDSGTPIPEKKISVAKGFDVKLLGRTLSVNVPGARTGASIGLYTLNGSRVAVSPLNAGRATLNLDYIQSGIYMVKVEGLGAQKVIVH